MKILHQSPALKDSFLAQVSQKKAENRQAAQEALGGGFLGAIGAAMFEFKQVTNQFKGSVGEWGISLLLKSLPDTWVMFNNAVIPTLRSGKFTEIDHLIIGPGGIFLIEVKTWKGSFSAYKDNWKRREGNDWVALSNSPSSQSPYHQKMFQQWISALVPKLPDNCILAPVVFPVAKWLGTNQCSVPVLHGATTLLQMIGESPNCLSDSQVLAIAQAVENLSLPSPTEPKPAPILKKPKPSKPQN